jgi:hypothetical protein
MSIGINVKFESLNPVVMTDNTWRVGKRWMMIRGGLVETNQRVEIKFQEIPREEDRR